MRVFVTGGTGFVGSPAADPVRFAEIDSGAIAALGEALAGTGKRTRERFGWEPAEPGLIEDIDARHYANAASTHQSA